MVEVRNTPERVTVSFAEKALDLRREGLPADWEVLLRDPEIAECVNALILERGAPSGEAQRPLLGWGMVAERLERMKGSTG